MALLDRSDPGLNTGERRPRDSGCGSNPPMSSKNISSAASQAIRGAATGACVLGRCSIISRPRTNTACGAESVDADEDGVAAVVDDSDAGT